MPIQFTVLTAPVSDQMTRAAPPKERTISAQCFLPITWGEVRFALEILRPSLEASHTNPISINWKMMVTTSGSMRVAAHTQKARSNVKEIAAQNAGALTTSAVVLTRTGSPLSPQ